MDGVTLEKIHEKVLSIKKDMNKIRTYFEEDELELSDEIKKQIVESGIGLEIQTGSLLEQ